MSRVHDLDIVVELDVRTRHRARALLGNPELSGIARVHTNGDLLEVQEDFDDVFLHALDARVLVEYTFDFRGG